MRILFLILWISLTLCYADDRRAAIVNGGVYKIQSDNDLSVLSANDNGVVSKALGKVHAEAWKNTDEQKWTVRTNPSTRVGSTQIMRRLSSRKNTNNVVSLQLSAPDTTATLRDWEIKNLGGTKWQIKNSDGLCLQNMGRGRAVAEKTCLSTNRNQRWEFMICNSLRCSETRR